MAFLEDVRMAQDNKVVFAAKSTPAKSTPTADVVNISGVLMRSVPAEYKAFGLDMTGYDEIAEAITKATQSKSERIILNVSSGGGMTDGIDVAIEAIRAAKSIKPVHAYTDGLVASAAYWLASQADNVFATRLTEVGGIGVYSVMYDSSKAMKDRGIEAVVARSGSVKGAGIYGDAITEEMRAVEQETVNAIADKFFNDVAAGRIEIDKDATTSGRTWLAETAKELNLIDGIVKNVFDLPDAINALTREAQSTATDTPEPQPEEPITMAEDHEGAVAAERERVMAISAAFADDQPFARKHIEAGSTLEAAKAAHYDILKTRNEALAAMADATPAPMKNVGEATAQSAPTGYFARMDELMAERGITRIEAAKIAERENPDAYRKECFGGGN
jgi:ClpP class serine protease